MSVRLGVVVAALFFVASCGAQEELAPSAETTAEQLDTTPTSTPPAAPTSAPASTTPPSEPDVDVGQPETLAIPAIDVDAELVELGLAENGSMETPEYEQNLAGWYVEGPKPGEPGPAVIAAHVDNANGADTFARLHELAPGDEITVTDDAGNEYSWTVQRSETSNKRELPYEEIWSDTEESVVRLVTCTGAYVDGSYVENLIVYAA